MRPACARRPEAAMAMVLKKSKGCLLSNFRDARFPRETIKA